MRSNSSLPSRISSRTNDSKDRSSETIEIFHETAATHHHSRTKQRRRIRSGKKKGEMFSLRTFIKGIHWHPRIPFRVHFVSLCPYKNENHLVPLHVIITHALHSTIEYIANATPTKSIHNSSRTNGYDSPLISSPSFWKHRANLTANRRFLPILFPNVSSWDQRGSSGDIGKRRRGAHTREKTGVWPSYAASCGRGHFYCHDFPMHIDLYKRQYLAGGASSDAPFPSTLRFSLSFFSTSSFHLILRGPVLPREISGSSKPTPFYTWTPRTVPSHDTPLGRNGSFRDTTRDSRLSTPLMHESTNRPPSPSSTHFSLVSRTHCLHVRGNSVTTRLRRSTVTTGWRIWRGADGTAGGRERAGDQVQTTWKISSFLVPWIVYLDCSRLTIRNDRDRYRGPRTAHHERITRVTGNALRAIRTACLDRIAAINATLSLSNSSGTSRRR